MGRFKSKRISAAQDRDARVLEAHDRDAKRPKRTPAAADQPVDDPYLYAPLPRHQQIRGRAVDNSLVKKAAIAVDYSEAGGSEGKAGRKVSCKWEVDASLPARYLDQTKARDLYVKQLGRCRRPGLLWRRPDIL